MPGGYVGFDAINMLLCCFTKMDTVKAVLHISASKLAQGPH